MQHSSLSSGLWFKPQSLEQLADAGAWTRGLMLYRSQKVLSLDIEPMQDHWLLLGEVQGSLREPYAVSIEMALMPDGQVDYWDSDCECPVGSQCKHGVALMLKAAYQGLQLLDGNSPYPMLSPPSPEQVETQRLANLARAQESARLEAEAQLLRWLQELDRTSGVATNAATTGLGSHATREDIRPAQFLYLLTVVGAHSPTPRLQMEAVVSYPKITGGWAKPKAIKSAPYKGQAVYDQASDADHQVLQLMRAMPDSSRFSYNFNSSVLPSGQAGLIALQQAASTGRLFLDDGKGGAGLPLQWGPSQLLSWHWQEAPNPQAVEPSWTLRSQLADSHAKLCLNSPPLYLDATLGLSARCGPRASRPPSSTCC